MSDYLVQLKNMTPKLSHRLTAAVAAECAERVRGVWGAYQDPCPELYKALDSIWYYAVTGDIHPKTTEYYDFITNILQPFRSEPDLEYHILIAIVSALEYTLKPSSKAIVITLTSAVDTATAVDRENQEQAKEEEVGFQLAVLKRSLTWENKPITKNIFDDLWVNDEPNWLSRAQDLE